MDRACAISDSRSARAGISLLEVLISMFVLLVGVLSVAALIPVGKIEMAEGTTIDRAASAGRMALRDAAARGYFAQPRVSVLHPGSTYCMWLTANTVDASSQMGLPVCIDPRGLATNGVAMAAFPYQNSIGAPQMTRLTLRCALGEAYPPMPQSLANARFMSADDIKFQAPSDGTLPAFQQLINGPRPFEGLFSWMFTVLPTADPELREVSAVCFNRRVLPLPAAAALPSERVFQVNMVGGGVGGGDVQVANGLGEAKPGSWVMLGAMVPNPNANPNQTPTFKWYRVSGGSKDLSADPFLTLQGPDWSPVMRTPATQSFIYLIDGVVGVYTKEIELEGPSAFTN